MESKLEELIHKRHQAYKTAFEGGFVGGPATKAWRSLNSQYVGLRDELKGVKPLGKRL